MCLAVVALDAHPHYALVVAANRDEYHARAATPAAWGREPPFANVLAGRDLVAGGTWLGVRPDGRWALVTNVRDPSMFDSAATSRGELVPRILEGDAPVDARLADIERARSAYNGFNLLAGDARAAWWMSNRAPDAARLGAGVNGLSNALLDTPWPKVTRTLDRVRAWSGQAQVDTEPLFDALADRAQAVDAELPSTGVSQDWERLLSPPFIVSERYGTRCSTVLTIDRDGHARFCERSFNARGEVTGEVAESFDVA